MISEEEPRPVGAWFSHNRHSAATNHRVAGAATFYNVDQTTPFGTSVTANGNGSPASITVSGTNSQQLVVDAFAANDTNTWIPGPGQTQSWYQTNTALGTIAGSFKVGAAVNTSTQWSGGTGSWAEVAVPINAVPGTNPDVLADRLHVASSGNVGVNNGNPQYTLDVTGTTRVQTMTNSTSALQIQNASGVNALTVDTTNMQVTVSTLVVGHIITTGTGCSSAGQFATITFSNAFASSPQVLLSATNAAASLLPVYSTDAPTHFAISTPNTPVNSTTYLFRYFTLQ